MFVITRLLVVIAVIFALQAKAEEKLPGIPNFNLDYPELTLQQYVLGPTCLSLQASPLDLSCNPAHLAAEDKQQLRINLATNDQISEVNYYRERLQAKDTAGIVDSVLKQREPVSAQATTAIWFQHDWWSVGFIPLRGGAATLMKNPAYPEISAHIYKERELFARAGLVATEDENLQAGLQLRYVDRDFFRKKFDFLDAVGNPDLLKIENQKAIYLEPGLSYSFASDWSSAVSMALTQTPIVQSGYKSPVQPVFDIGFATSPPFAGGHLRTTTHYSSHPDLTDLFSRLRWSAVYDFETLASVSASLGKNVIALGVNGHIDSVVLGIGFKTEEIWPDPWRSERISTALFEAGLVF